MNRRLQVVGAGLLGTSVGLALAGRAWQVWVADEDPAAEALAAGLGAGSAGWADGAVDLVLLCVPPAVIDEVMSEVHRLYPHATVSDVASIKSEPQRCAESLGIAERFVGGHPMAGRERSGGVAAQADLFESRPWAICPTTVTDPERVALVEELVRACGADPIVVDAGEHDAAVALVSHVPQVAASAVAGLVTGSSDLGRVLAGQGLRDTVRIAGSDPALWEQILTANSAAVAPLVAELAARLGEVAEALHAMAVPGNGGESVHRENASAIHRLLADGLNGYRSIPGKHGAPPTEYVVVPVLIPDEPGALARLFTTVASSGASVEDISLEHSPGHPVGIVELSVRPERADALRSALAADGWSAH